MTAQPDPYIDIRMPCATIMREWSKYKDETPANPSN